jgi:type IV secretory pathway VirB6-like protein
LASINSRSLPVIYPLLQQAGGGPYVATLTGNLTIDNLGPRVLVLNPGAAARTLAIPNPEPNHNGDYFEIRHTGTVGTDITVTDTTGNTLIVLSDGDIGAIWNARGVYSGYKSAGGGAVSGTAFTTRVTTTDGVASGTAKVVGGRFNQFTAAADSITAATSNGSFVDFATTVTLPANTLASGSLLKLYAMVYVSDAAAGAETLSCKLTLGSTVLITTTAVNPAGNDFQILEFDIAAKAAPGATASVIGAGEWFTKSGASEARGTNALIPGTTFATNGALIAKVSAIWSASVATTTATLYGFYVTGG